MDAFANQGPSGREGVLADSIPKEKIEKCDALLVRAVEIFADEVSNLEALTPEAVQSLASRIRDDEHWAPRQQFLVEVDQCLTAFEESIWSQARRQYFERFMVRSFVHLFPADSRNPQGKGLLSRRILPGFFTAIEMMVGKEFFEKCQTACKRIVHERQEDEGGPVPWSELRHDNKAHLVIDDALVVVSRHFTDLDMRLDWLTDLINSNLAPWEDYSFEGQTFANWEASRVNVKNMLRCLYWSFKVRLAKPEGSTWFDGRYGAEARETMDALLATLYSDENHN